MDLAEIKNRRRTGNQRDGWLISHSEYTWLVSEIERLQHWEKYVCPRCHGIGEITVMSGQTPENFSQDNIPCPDCVGPIIDERGKYKAVLEWIAKEANTGESGDAGVMRDAARKALSEVP